MLKLFLQSTPFRFTSPFLLRTNRDVSFYPLLLVKNHYEVLGVARDASKEDIKAAFVRLSKKHHPDVSSNDSDLTFIRINEAYSTLVDSVKRSSYDYELDVVAAFMRPRDPRYAGSHGYGSGGPIPGVPPNYGSRYYGDFDHVHHVNSTGVPVARRDHGRVVRWLILLTIFVTCFHTFRINYTHKEFSRASEEETQRNHEIYKGLRERARSSTVEEQLETFVRKQSEGLEKMSKISKSR